MKRVLHLKIDENRYRKFERAKANLPKHLSAKEYEEAIKMLAKKFKI